MATTEVASSSSHAIAEHQKPILDHIPETLKRLSLFLVKSFFSKEHYVVMDYIIKLECVREEDLRNLLKLEQKYLRQLLLQLRQDKLVKERTGQEELEGKKRNISYYFTNYRAIVNVAKYKVDHMRIRLEAREKTKTHRASYKCTQCQHHYDALDMDKIYDPKTDGLVCYHCQGSIENDTSVGPDDSTRSSLAKFNEQMMVLFSMIQQLDGIRLAPHLLEPSVNNSISAQLKQKAAQQEEARYRVGERAFSSAEANRSEMYRTDVGFTVSFDHGQQPGNVVEKESVPWLEASVHNPSAATPPPAVHLPKEIEQQLQRDEEEEAPASKKPRVKADEILGMLREELETASSPDEALSQDRRSPSASTHAHEPGTFQKESEAGRSERTDFSSVLNEESGASESKKNEEMSDDGDEFVHVQGVRYHLDDITTALVEKMTESEKKAYTELTMDHFDY